jgi:CHAD domain-containing protein
VLTALEPVPGQYKLSGGARRTETVTYLDTVDWRLHKRHLALSHHRRASGPGELVLSNARRTWRTALDESPSWPAKVDQLAPGPVRDAASEAMWVRAVEPVLRSREVVRDVTVLNEDGKTVVRIEWLEVGSIQPRAEQPFVRVQVRPVLGYRADAERVVRALVASGRFERSQTSVFDAMLHAVVPDADEDDHASITRGMPADIAIATALLGFADAIASNVDGVRRDVDTEYLHELRVAVRRTRSLLKLAGDVLPADLASRYAPEFKWLGDVTTPCRDLDVYLLEIDELAEGLEAGEPEDLDPFAELLSSRRQAERRRLLRALRSQRFTLLLDGWRKSLTEVVEAGTAAGGRTIEEFAADRIRKATRKVVRQARSLTPESPSDDIHSLRKRCKELRYLLEMFGPVYDATAHRRVVKDLKRVQDVLGSFQDGEVQSAGLRAYANEMLEHGSPPAATLLAMGELSARFARMQRKARHDLVGALERYLRPKTRNRIEAVLQ